MSVTIDAASAARLLAEGAICFDADTSAATRDGQPVRLPAGTAGTGCPVLVCGSSPAMVHAAVARLERWGLPAWQVADGEDSGGEKSGGLPAGS